MSTLSTTKAYTKILDGMISEMADIYTAGKESGQCEIALKEQIRTSFIKIFKMDLLQATTCTQKVIDKCEGPEDLAIQRSRDMLLNPNLKLIRRRAIQNAFAHS